MAYDAFQDFAEKDKDKEQSNQQNGVQIGTGSPVIQSPGASQGGGEAGQPQQTKSGSYTNLQSYLNANKEQGSKFGQDVAGRVDTQIQGAQKQVQNFGNAFTNEVAKNTVNPNEALYKQVQADPTKVAGADYAKLRDARYMGPKTASDLTGEYQKTQAALDKASQGAQATGTESGRKAFLEEQYGTPAGNAGYTAGQKKLDNFLIQSAPDSRQALEALKGKADAARQGYDELSKRLEGVATQGQQTTQEAQLKARQALGLDDTGMFTKDSAYNKMLGAIEKRASDANTYKTSDYNALLKAIQDRSLSPDQISRLGIGGNLYGVDATQYLKGAGQVDKSQAATQAEYNRLKALSELAGRKDETGLDATKVGTGDLYGRSAFDTKGANTAIQGQQSALDRSLNSYGSSWDNPAVANALASIDIHRPPHGSSFDSLNGALDSLNQWAAANGSWSNGNARLQGKPMNQVRAVYAALVAERDRLMNRYGANDLAGKNYQAPGGGKSAPVTPAPPDFFAGAPGVPVGIPEKPSPGGILSMAEILQNGGTVADYQNQFNPGKMGLR